jgi:hypothetical protein
MVLNDRLRLTPRSWKYHEFAGSALEWARGQAGASALPIPAGV